MTRASFVNNKTHRNYREEDHCDGFKWDINQLERKVVPPDRLVLFTQGEGCP